MIRLYLNGVLAQLGEHRTCNAKVVGAEPTYSTKFNVWSRNRPVRSHGKLLNYRFRSPVYNQMIPKRELNETESKTDCVEKPNFCCCSTAVVALPW